MDRLATGPISRMKKKSCIHVSEIYWLDLITKHVSK